jgi:alpha-beta hydrolase superfamily lysophospholipase
LVVNVLIDNGFHVIAQDLPGHGLDAQPLSDARSITQSRSELRTP